LIDDLYVIYWFGLVFIVFNANFKNISVISWRSENSFIGGGNQSTQRIHRTVASHLQTLSHNVVSSTPHHEWDSNSQLYW
jgi:hypothetical protein